jgi:hypothetical protein
LDNLKLIAFFTSDPLLTLKLGINEKRISFAGNNYSSVFKRHSVSRKSFSVPNSLISISGKNFKRINTISEWNLLINNIWQPGLFP